MACLQANNALAAACALPLPQNRRNPSDRRQEGDLDSSWSAAAVVANDHDVVARELCSVDMNPLLLLLSLAAAQSDPALLAGLEYRQLHLTRGGRSTAVTGVAADSFTF